MSWILGVSALFHDAAAALIHDGVVVAAASEERFSRLKHDASLPLRAARWCLAQAGIEAGDLDHVVFYEKPLRKLERIVVSQALAFPRSLPAFTGGLFKLLSDKLWVGQALCAELGVSADKVLFCEHHRAHAASVFHTSPVERAAVLVVDGVGEWATTSLYDAGPGGLRLLEEVHFPHSIGLTWSAFTAYLGFRVNEGEFKVMGLAPYGTPRFVEEVRQVLRLHEDGSFENDLSAVRWHWSTRLPYDPAAFERRFGPARFPGAPLDPTTGEGRRFADVAASLQVVTEEALLGLARRLHRATGHDTLCLSGGVALNCVANARILAEGPFSRLFVHPAAGDAGGALGAALWAWREVVGGAPVDPGLRPDLGRAWTDGWTRDLLDDLGATYAEVDPAAAAAADLAAGRVVGWCQGRFEWGPRALGHRSILADAGAPGMRDRVNARIKFREAFRPFAPAAPAEVAGEHFVLPAGAEEPLRWMQCVVPARDPAALPATSHVDGSARLQVVDAERSPLFHRLLTALGAHTGRPVALNTSFNLKGEPIVSSPVHALSTFGRSGLDALYLGPFRVARPVKPPPG